MGQTSDSQNSVNELSLCDLTLWGLFQMGTSQLTTGNLVQIAQVIETLGATEVAIPFLTEVPHRDIDWRMVSQQFQQTTPVVVVNESLPAPILIQEYVEGKEAGSFRIRLSADTLPVDLNAWLEELEGLKISVKDRFSCELDLASTSLVEELEQLRRTGVKKIILADRSGVLLPTQVEQILKMIASSLLKKLDCQVQFRNDMGVAVANSLVSLAYGVTGVDCALIGVGPYAGFTPLEEVAVTLALHHEQFRFNTAIQTEGLVQANELVAGLAGFGLVPNKPISGENIFATEAGIHQDGLLKNLDTYLPFRPELVGAEGIQLVIGRHSGRRAVQHRLDELGFTIPEKEVLEVLEMIKQLPKGQKVDNEILTEFAMSLKSA